MEEIALSVKNEEADRLARELAGTTGESITEAVLVALRERLERERGRRGVADALTRLVEELAGYPVLDPRPADQILGYDDGLPR
jgi:antitoxin VapB